LIKKTQKDESSHYGQKKWRETGTYRGCFLKFLCISEDFKKKGKESRRKGKPCSGMEQSGRTSTISSSPGFRQRTIGGGKRRRKIQQATIHRHWTTRAEEEVETEGSKKGRRTFPEGNSCTRWSTRLQRSREKRGRFRLEGRKGGRRWRVR